MRRSYDIGGRTVTLRANVHVWIAYKAQFGAELPEDIQRAAALDAERSKCTDQIQAAALLGQEYRLFLQILWAFASEGTEGLPPFDRWVKTVGGVDIADIVRTVTDLYIRTMKPDRRYRVGGEKSGEGEGSITAEELTEMLYSTGADSTALKDLTVGMALNLVHAHVNAARRAKGEKVSDPEQQYKQIKEMLDAIESGEIPMESVDMKEYERLKKAVKEWEDGE